MVTEISYHPLNLYTQFKNAADKTPDVPIILDTPFVSFPELGEKNTYKSVHEAILKRAYQLGNLGLKKEDFIVIYKSSAVDTYFLAVAATYLGAIPVMVSHHLSARVLDVFAERLEKSWFLYDEETKERVFEMATTVPVHKLSIKELVDAASDFVSSTLLPEDVIQYMTHTSGTTGVPKLICHSAQSMGWRVAWQETIFEKMAKKGLLAFHISPVHSRYNIGFSSAIELGFPLMPLSSAKKDNVSQMLHRYQPMALETHPNNFIQWARFAKKEPSIFSSVRYYHSTFDAINLGTLETFLTASHNQNPVFMQVYGQSECGPMILRYHRLDTIHQTNGRDMGVGLKGYTTARITDEKGNELPQGENGHIQLYSKGRALTYYKEDERFKENVYGDWWDSGDYGCLTPEGTLLLKDRQVDLIKTIDSNLAIEDFLLDKLSFLDEVIIVRDKDDQPQPILAVSNEAEMDWDAWWHAVNDLPLLNEPIIMAFDDIPRTATMKVQRLKIERELKHRHLQDIYD
ncbi:AMP-binding protein [Streptococcus zalophi]|uniref:Acyl-CoA synthetase n=1 Tax=Streptococcus zalophi TaxID=640031 RepID=A0A934P949_9STRE|nr:acyl-CoA synthetase [Streptococcus zalophi]MBJ8349253.1 acyl-CoA synthetase [Streptococcus zalophi]MCR8967125.1 acyl-CoA synthetase [Streptococcus zalophi]